MSRKASEICCVYGLVHRSERCFKIGYAVSMDTRVKNMGEHYFDWKVGVVYVAGYMPHAREVEGLAHRAMRGWKLRCDEIEESVGLLPISGATEWFSTKGFPAFIIWMHKNRKKLGVNRIPFHAACKFAEHAPLDFYRNVSRIAKMGLEPKGRSVWLARMEAQAQRPKLQTLPPPI